MKSKYSFIALSFLVLSNSFALDAHAGRSKPSASPESTASLSATASALPISSARMRTTPYRGMIDSVDNAAKTFTIAGKQNSRALRITDKTLITKAGQPATMKDVVANEEVRGSYYKSSDGSMEAKTVKLGPLTDAEKAEKEARQAKRSKPADSVAPSTAASP